MNWITVGEYRKLSPKEKKAIALKEFEQSKDMSLNDLYAELGKMPNLESHNNK